MQAAQQAQQQAQQQQHEMFLQQNLPGGAGRGLRLAGGPPLSIVAPDGLPGRLFGGAGGLRAALGQGGRLGARDMASAAAARAASAAAEPEGPPPLDEADLAVLISLLRTSLPLSKQHLQKLFLNLAAHSSSREQLLKMLLSLLRALPGTSAAEGAEAAAGDEASDSMQTGTSGRAGMDISEDGSSHQQQQPAQEQQQQGLSAALDRLGAAAERPADAAGAAAQAADGVLAASTPTGLLRSPQGKPAVVSRRVLDMLSYLSRNSAPVSRKMLSLRIPEPQQQALLEADAKGKGKMVVEAEQGSAALPPRAIEVLLAMLSAPLCQRSVSLLEQLMLLMEVVLTMVQRYEADMAALAALEEAQQREREAEAERKQQREQQQREREQQRQQAAQQPQPEGQQEAAPQQAGGSAAEPAQQQQQQQSEQPSLEVKQQQEPKQQQKQQQQPPPNELASTMAGITPSLLRQLPGLLAREVLSEPAYASIGKVIKLIVESAPVHLPLMLSELVEGAAGVADALLGYLDTAAQRGIDADAQLAPAIGTKSSVVLRMLYALQGFQNEVQERLKQQQQKEQEAATAAAAEGAAQPGSTGAAADAAAGAAAGSSGAGDTSAAGGSAGAGPSSSAAAGRAGASSSAGAAATAGPVDAAAAASEVSKAVSSVAARTAPLWKSLSSCILRIEDNLRAVLPQHTQAGGESVGNAAARLLPPGAQQVLPLVEAFFVLCALQGAIPSAATPAKDLLSAPSLDLNALNALMPSTSSGGAAAGAAAGGAGAAAGTSSAGAAGAASGGAAAVSGLTTAGSSHLWRPASMSLGEAGSSGASGGDVTLPFLKFAERHRRLLNTYIRRNTSLLESSLAPLLRVPKLIDFDNKRAYFRWVLL